MSESVFKNKEFYPLANPVLDTIMVEVKTKAESDYDLVYTLKYEIKRSGKTISLFASMTMVRAADDAPLMDWEPDLVIVDDPYLDFNFRQPKNVAVQAQDIELTYHQASAEYKRVHGKALPKLVRWYAENTNSLQELVF